METCSLCQGFVPVDTNQCPNCDARLARPKKGFIQKLLGAVAGGALSMTLMACYGCPPPVCGDGNPEPWGGWGGNVEECDDGNAISGDGCSSSCQIEFGCGDGIRYPDEECDDNNIFDGDGCSSFCNEEPGFVCSEESPSVCTTLCGDGILIEEIVSGNQFLGMPEECDDGNLIDGDGCSAECQSERCGDGIINDSGTEECDNGAANAYMPGACREDCRLPVCGDYIIDPGEECDRGPYNGTEGTSNFNNCRIDCALPHCGDGILDDGEVCDDGNTLDTDACINSCQQLATCGDGFTQIGVEECDDGNTTNTDACLNACLNARCGDGFMRHDLVDPQDPALEQCDDGNQDDTDTCKNDCTSN